MGTIINSSIQSDIDIISFAQNLVTGFALSLLIIWHFNKHSRSLSNHSVFSRIFPLITVTTLLVITIIKSSLALSLGLVGALSIVRFRTPIKDPEELGYIFLSIAVGLGLGADRWLETVLALTGILAGMSIYYRFSEKYTSPYMYIVVNIPEEFESKGEDVWKLNGIIRKLSIAADMRRMELGVNDIEVSFLAKLDSEREMSSISNDIKALWPSAIISFIEQRQNVFA
jgi:hypothetical protein